MVAIEKIVKIETDIKTHSGDTLYATEMTIDSSEFVANATYICWAFSQLHLASTSHEAYARIAEGATPTLIPGAEFITELGSGTRYLAQFLYTAPSTPVDLVYQHKSSDSGREVRSDSITFIAWRLDVALVENTDWFFAEDDDTGGLTALTSTWVDFPSVTFTPSAGDDWLVIGYGNCAIDNIGLSSEFRFRRDGTATSPTETGPIDHFEGEDAVDQLHSMIFDVFNLDGSEHTLAQQMRDASSGTQNNHLFSNIFVVNLEKFEEHGFSESGSHNPSTAALEELAGPAPFTPITNPGLFTIFGFAQTVTDTAAGVGLIAISVDGTYSPLGSENPANLHETDLHDGNDEKGTWAMTSESLGASADLDLDGKVDDAGVSWQDIKFLYISDELAGGAAPRRRILHIG